MSYNWFNSPMQSLVQHQPEDQISVMFGTPIAVQATSFISGVGTSESAFYE